MTNEDPNAPTQGAPTPPRRSSRQGVGGSPMGSTLSIVLAVVAVVAGFLILRNITNDSSSSDGSSPTETSVASTVASTIPAVTSSTVPPLVTQGATVVVANASGVPGSAGRMSAELAGAGFTMAEPTNATSALEQSVVYYDPSNAAAQSVATSVAQVMGGLVVETVPTPPPVEGETLGDAGVVVMLGSAQADKTLVQLDPTAAPTGTAPPVAGATGTTITATTTG
ncbi:MAG TPA: LytR C-terminal domain-containing protein [Ilumatobacteraceae bacterium]|nr:LytR C-terminal domain-containing protein [Ilumatobacteraceae bacterium]